MGEGKRCYSPKIQSDFDKLWQYVREWLREGETETETSGSERLNELVAKLRKLLEEYP